VTANNGFREPQHPPRAVATHLQQRHQRRRGLERELRRHRRPQRRRQARPRRHHAAAAPSSVLLGNGGRHLRRRDQLRLQRQHPPANANLGDLNRDGKLDVVVSNVNGGTISVLLGNGAGALAAGRHYATGFHPGGSALADLDGDGDLDLAVACRGVTTTSVLLGKGDGTFTRRTSTTPPAPTPEAARAADLDGDGLLDLAVSCRGDGSGVGGGLAILHNSGAGVVRRARRLLRPAPTRTPPPLARPRRSQRRRPPRPTHGPEQLRQRLCGVFLNKGDGTFNSVLNYSVGNQPMGITSADVDGDGRADVVTANFSADGVSVLLGNAGLGNGKRQPPRVDQLHRRERPVRRWSPATSIATASATSP